MGIISNVTGDGAEDRMKKGLLDALPAADNDIDPTTALQRLNQLEKKAVYSFAPRGVQQKVQLVRKFVTLLHDKQMVKFDNDALNDKLLSVAITQFAFFVRSPPSGQQGGHQNTKYGSEALSEIWEEITNESTDKISFEQLKIFDTYEWLVPQDIKVDVKKMIQDKAQDIEAKLAKMQSVAAAAAKQSSRNKASSKPNSVQHDSVKAAMADFGM